MLFRTQEGFVAQQNRRVADATGQRVVAQHLPAGFTPARQNPATTGAGIQILADHT